jgi:hypothetical protein
MVVVREGDALRISSEVMLRSEITDSGKANEIPVESFMFVALADRAYLVLSTGMDEGAAQGPVRLLSRGRVYAAGRQVKTEAIPKSLAAMAGQPVQLFSVGGIACLGTAGKPMLMRRVIPHFGTRGYWKGEPEFGGSGNPLSGEAMAREIWELGQSDTLLVSPLQEVRGKCDNALWGRARSQPNPVFFMEIPLSDEKRDEIVKAARALPAYKIEQKAFRSAEDHDGSRYWELFGGAVPEIKVLRNADRRLRSFYAAAGTGCGGFHGTFWALFDVIGEKPLLLTDAKRPPRVKPLAVFNVNGDRMIEVLAADLSHGGGEAFLLFSERIDWGFDLVRRIEIPDLDCGC